MKKLVQLFIFASLLFCVQSLNAQEAPEGEDYLNVDRYFPIIGDNNAFGLGGNTYVNTSIFTIDGPELFAHFLNWGITDQFSLAVGTAAQDFLNPELFYITPEVALPLSDNVTLNFELISIFSEDFDDIVLNPGVMLSIGTPAKNISFGYALAIDSDGDVETMAPLDGFYSVAGIRLNGRIPVSDQIGIFSKNDFSSQDEFTFIVSRTGAEFQLPKINIYGGLNIARSSFFGNSSTETNFVIGASFKLNNN